MASRTIDLQPDGRRLSISFPYDRKLVSVVRGLPQRRFDRDTKAWSVPIDHLEEVLGQLDRHRFQLTARLLAYCEEEGRDVESMVQRGKQRYKPLIDESVLPEGTWTVATLNAEVREVLRAAFREEFWVAAEIQGLDRAGRGGHAFFELVHRPHVGADPVARVSAVMWEEQRRHVEALLREDGGDVRLSDGLVVRMLCRADFFPGQGRYQVQVSDLDLAYTSGTIHQRRERVLRELSQRGIIDQNVSKAWPVAPLRLGLITSDGSDACADFLHELERSGLGFEITLHHANVQGARTERSVLDALEYFAQRAEHYDAVAVVRGGGARSDLAYFDTQAIGEAVCLHPCKIIVGVGHQRDICLLDLIAHSEKTPTAAAQYFVGRVGDYMERQRLVQRRLVERAEFIVLGARRELDEVSSRTLRVVGHVVEQERRRLDRTSYAINEVAQRRISSTAWRFEGLALRVPQAAENRLKAARAELDFAQRRVEPERLERALQRRLEHLDGLTQRLERASQRQLERACAAVEREGARLRLLDPVRILERGFSVVRRRGAIVRDPSGVEPGDVVELTMAAGRVHAIITEERDE
ncbi:MAG: exodeoxyribonuclease VII large subunit [Myxococcota bacterium]